MLRRKIERKNELASGKRIVADEPMAQARRERAGARRTWPRVLLVTVLIIGLAAGIAVSWQEGLSLQGVAERGEDAKLLVAQNPVLAPIAFGLISAMAIALSFPAVALLKIIGGFLFGWLPGTAFIVVATTIGGMGLFLASRSAFGGFLRDRAGTAGRFAEEFERGAFTYIIALRLAPFVPFALVSIAPALFEVRLRTFLAATVIGVLPGAMCYAWLGEGLDDAFAAARAAGRPLRLADLVTPEITVALLALALVAVLAAIVRKIRGTRAA